MDPYHPFIVQDGFLLTEIAGKETLFRHAETNETVSLSEINKIIQDHIEVELFVFNGEIQIKGAKAISRYTEAIIQLTIGTILNNKYLQKIGKYNDTIEESILNQLSLIIGYNVRPTNYKNIVYYEDTVNKKQMIMNISTLKSISFNELNAFTDKKSITINTLQHNNSAMVLLHKVGDYSLSALEFIIDRIEHYLGEII